MLKKKSKNPILIFIRKQPVAIFSLIVIIITLLFFNYFSFIRHASLTNIISSLRKADTSFAVSGLSGTYHASHGDSFDGKPPQFNEVILTDDGQTYSITTDSQKKLSPGSRVSFSGTVNKNVLSPTSLTLLSSPSAIKPALTAGSASVAIFPFYFSDTPNKPPFDKNAIADAANKARDYFLETSFSNTTIDFYLSDWVQISSSSKIASSKCDEIWQWQREVDLKHALVTGYDLYIYVFPKIGCEASGIAGRDEIFINGPQPPGVYIHELGHHYKFGHANAINCGSQSIDSYSKCTRNDAYGDPVDPMGNTILANNSARHFNAAFKQAAGMLSLNQTQVSSTAYYNLNYIEKSAAIPQALRIQKKDSNEEYVLTYRNRVGSDNVSQIPEGGATYLHIYSQAIRQDDITLGVRPTFLVDMTPGDNKFDNAYFVDGKEFCDSTNKISIKQISHTATSARLYIDINSSCTATGSPPPGSPPATLTACPVCDAKDKLTKQLEYCYGNINGTSVVRSDCDYMSTQVNQLYTACADCQGRKNTCSICPASTVLKNTVDWCYTKIGKAGITNNFCNELATHTRDCQDECAICSTNPPGGGNPNPGGPTPTPLTMWDIKGHVRDVNGKGIPGVVVQVDGKNAQGQPKSYFPVTDQYGIYKQGGFIVKGEKYRVIVKGNVEGKAPAGFKFPAYTSWQNMTKNWDTRQDTPIGSTSYDAQIAGSNDCASEDNTRSGSVRCDFVYTTDGNKNALYPKAPTNLKATCDATSANPSATLTWTNNPRATMGNFIRVDNTRDSWNPAKCSGAKGNDYDRCVDGSLHSSLVVKPIQLGAAYTAWIASGNKEGVFTPAGQEARVSFTCNAPAQTPLPPPPVSGVCKDMYIGLLGTTPNKKTIAVAPGQTIDILMNLSNPLGSVKGVLNTYNLNNLFGPGNPKPAYLTPNTKPASRAAMRTVLGTNGALSVTQFDPQANYTAASTQLHWYIDYSQLKKADVNAANAQIKSIQFNGFANNSSLPACVVSTTVL